MGVKDPAQLGGIEMEASVFSKIKTTAVLLTSKQGHQQGEVTRQRDGNTMAGQSLCPEVT